VAVVSAASAGSGSGSATQRFGRLRVGGLGLGGRLRQQAGNAEVADLDARGVAIADGEDVRRLEIAVDHAAAVDRREALRDLADDRDRPDDVAVARRAPLERRAVHLLHHDVPRARR